MKNLSIVLGLSLLLAACGNEEDNNSPSNIKSGNVQPNNATTNAGTNNAGTNNSTVNNTSTNGSNNTTTGPNNVNNPTNNGTVPPINNDTNTVPPGEMFSVWPDADEEHIMSDVQVTFDGFENYSLSGVRGEGLIVRLFLVATGPGTFDCSVDEFVPFVEYNVSSMLDQVWSSEGGACSFTVVEASGFGGVLEGSFTSTLKPVDPNVDPDVELRGEFNVDIGQ